MAASTSPPPVLTALARDLHVAETSMRFPGGVQLPLRMTVVRLPGGGLVLHSAIPAAPSLVAEVSAVGPVAHVIAPSRTHHLHVRGWLDRFPSALVHGAPGLAAKRPDLSFASVLGDSPSASPWAAVLDQTTIAGAPRLAEVAFLHRPSRTLIVTDLLFHLLGSHNLATRLVLALNGTANRLAMSRLWRLVTRDRKALRASLERVLSWEFTRLIPAHGAVLEGADTAAQVRAAVEWGLRA